MKFVYDFTTSQANGTIASVCLTHANGGYTSYGGADAVIASSYPLGIRFDEWFFAVCVYRLHRSNNGR